MGVELLKRFPPPASKTAQPNYPADALFNLKLGIAMAEFEFKPDNRSFFTKLGEVARVTATATLCVLDNTNKTLVVTNKVLEQAIDVVDHACDSLTEDFAEFLSNRAGSKITAHDIRSGRAAKIIEKSSERRLAIAAEEGRHRREQEERQLAKRMKKAKEALQNPLL